MNRQVMGKMLFFIFILLVTIGNGVLLLLRILKFVLIMLYKILANLFILTYQKIQSRVHYYRGALITFKRKLAKRSKRQRASLKRLSSFTWLVKLKYFILGIIFSFLFLFCPILFFITIQNLPNPNALSQTPLPQTTKIYDRHHILLYEIYATQNRTLISLSDIPTYLKEATIAIEDKNFYTNPGFDIAAIMRAFFSNISGNELQGGSTITQQLIKSSLLTPEKTLTRKMEEIILAFWAEKIYTKKQILEMYFNQVPYGGTAWGIEAASEVYFNKHVNNLDLAQCAFLAGLPRAPTFYSPFGATPNLWKNREKEVLNRMVELGYITKQQKQQAEEEELVFQPSQIPLHAPHFSFYIKNLLVKKYGLPTVEKGGLEVTTSLDLNLQNKAQSIVSDEVNKDAYLQLTNGASVITNPSNGDILAMVGSKDYNDPDGGNVNIATSYRQPGSSIKIVTYTSALAHGFTPASIIVDGPITFQSAGSANYSPVNYDGKWHGSITLRTAFANSFNIPAVKVLNTIGIPVFIDTAKKMGIESLIDPSQYGLSITLGGAEVTMLDMATAYGTLANQGNRVDLNPILKITDYKGTILEEKHIEPKPVIDPGISFIVSNILADNAARSLEFGSNSPLVIPGHTVSVKTGTSDNKRDNWTDGYTKDFVVIVWVGNNDNSPMSETLASGITGAAPIWHNIMAQLLQSKSDESPSIPINVIQKSCSGRVEYFILGTENTTSCNFPSPSFTPFPATPTPQKLTQLPDHPSQRRILLFRVRRVK